MWANRFPPTLQIASAGSEQAGLEVGRTIAEAARGGLERYTGSVHPAGARGTAIAQRVIAHKVQRTLRSCADERGLRTSQC